MSTLESLFFKFVPASLRRALRHGLITLVRAILIPPIFRKRIAAEPGPPEISVHLLVSQPTWKMGILAAKSFRHFTGREWNVFIHDDGTLCPKELAQIRDFLPGATVIARGEAEPVMDRALANFPLCRENRKKHNWFLKVFDCNQFAPAERYIVLDTDLLFFDRPKEIMDWAGKNDGTCWFNRDGKECYALPRAEIERDWPYPLWERVNSGLCLLQKEALSLARCEEFLAKFLPVVRHFMFLEQTLFAVNASAHGRGGLLPPQYEISWNNFRRPDGVCRHYVGIFKHDMFFIEGVATLFWRMFVTPRRAPHRAHVWR